jgi:hypothetical protein
MDASLLFDARHILDALTRHERSPGPGGLQRRAGDAGEGPVRRAFRRGGPRRSALSSWTPRTSAVRLDEEPARAVEPAGHALDAEPRGRGRRRPSGQPTTSEKFRAGCCRSHYHIKSRGMERSHSREQTSKPPSHARNAARITNVSRVHDIRKYVSIRIRNSSRERVSVRCTSATALSGSSSSTSYLELPSVAISRPMRSKRWTPGRITVTCSEEAVSGSGNAGNTSGG